MDNDAFPLAAQFFVLREELPANYIRRDGFRQGLGQIFSALRRVEDQLYQKADRP